MVIRFIIRIGIFLILARVILSWVAPNNQHPAAVFLTRVTEPVLTPVRNVIGTHSGIDFSPIVVLVILYVMDALALGLLR
jgi:YggT family protein